MKRKRKESTPVAVTQLRGGETHPFGALRSFSSLGGGEERLYRQIREAIPVLDAAVGKLVRLSGGFHVSCRNAESQQKLEEFLRTVPCGRGQVGVDSFLAGYIDSLLTKKEEKTGKANVGAFLNTLTQTLQKIQLSGIAAVSERRETESQIVLTITIPK